MVLVNYFILMTNLPALDNKNAQLQYHKFGDVTVLVVKYPVTRSEIRF